MAWVLCSTVDATWCTSKRDLGWLGESYASAARKYSAVMLGGESPANQDLWTAHQYCFLVTLGQSLPAFFGAVVGVYVFLALLRLPFAILAASVQLGAQVLSYTHAHS